MGYRLLVVYRRALAAKAPDALGYTQIDFRIAEEWWAEGACVLIRNRLRASVRPRRFLEDTRVTACVSGVMRYRVRLF